MLVIVLAIVLVIVLAITVCLVMSLKCAIVHPIDIHDYPIHKCHFVSGVTTILATAGVGITVREGLPRVSYATALDVYLNVCIVYEMAAMIEYAAVNYFTKVLPLEGGADTSDDEEEEKPPDSSVRVYLYSEQVLQIHATIIGNQIVFCGSSCVMSRMKVQDNNFIFLTITMFAKKT